MAIQTKVYTSTNNGFTLELTLVENSTSTTANTSSIGYTLKLKSTSKDFSQYGVGATVQMDGKTVATRDRYSAPQISIGTYSSVTLLSGTTTVGHNTDGKKSMSVKFTLDMATASWTPGPMTGTATMTLTNIPRQATITSAPNFTDEDSPVVKYNNPAGMKIELCIKNETGSKFLTAYRTVSGSQYTFNFTQDERKALQAYATQNSAKVSFVLRTAETFFNNSIKTLTIKNPSPTLNPTVEDINPATFALTGNANTMVKGYSNAKVTTGAKAVKQATLKSQKVTCWKKTLTGNGTMNAVESGTFTFEATDSRGNTTKKSVTKTLIDYFPPTCSIQSGTPDLLGRFTLKASGVAFSGNFGAVKNSVTVQYRYRTQGSTSWSSWESMSISGVQNYTATASLSGLDTKTAYEFQARVTDKLTTTDSAVKVVRTTPLVILKNGMVDICGTLAIKGVPLPILDQVDGLGEAVQKAEQAAAAADVAKQAAEEAKVTAAQSVSESQAAKEAAAQSAQVAQDAKAAADEALSQCKAIVAGNEAYTKQESHDTFARALVTDTGKGTSHEIYPDAGSNIVVTSYGYTEQEGEGDPSPENVRPIKVGGIPMVEKTIVDADGFYQFPDTQTPVLNLTPYVKDSQPLFGNKLRGFVYSEGPQDANKPFFRRTGELPGTKVFFFPPQGINTYADSVEFFKSISTIKDPLRLWYAAQNASESSGLYACFKVDGKNGDTFSGGAIKLNSPLCNGDYVVTNHEGQCLEVHTNLFYELTGTETLNFYETYLSLDLGVDTKTDSKNSLCSIAKFNTSSSGDGFYFTGKSVVFGSEFVKHFGGGLAFVQKLKDLYVNGNPVQLQIPLASPITHTHAPVPMIAKPDATGKVTVSGERDVSAVYNKSLAKAFEELSTAILNLGGST